MDDPPSFVTLQRRSSRPLSDKELSAAFTPQEESFFRWFQWTGPHYNRKNFTNEDRGVYRRFIQDSWLDPSEFQAYNEWAISWLYRHVDKCRRPVSDVEFFERIRTTNFAKKDEVARHVQTVRYCGGPMIILGEGMSNGGMTCFAVKPSLTFLWPNNISGNSLVSELPGVLHESVLAINLDVRIGPTGQPLDRLRLVKQELVTNSRGERVPDSVVANGSAQHRFVFAQLGQLCHYGGH